MTSKTFWEVIELLWHLFAWFLVLACVWKREWLEGTFWLLWVMLTRIHDTIKENR